MDCPSFQPTEEVVQPRAGNPLRSLGCEAGVRGLVRPTRVFSMAPLCFITRAFGGVFAAALS